MFWKWRISTQSYFGATVDGHLPCDGAGRERPEHRRPQETGPHPLRAGPPQLRTACQSVSVRVEGWVGNTDRSRVRIRVRVRVSRGSCEQRTSAIDSNKTNRYPLCHNSPQAWQRRRTLRATFTSLDLGHRDGAGDSAGRTPELRLEYALCSGHQPTRTLISPHGAGKHNQHGQDGRCSKRSAAARLHRQCRCASTLGDYGVAARRPNLWTGWN